jgi:CheY-like chemotaxis protein
MSLKVLIADDDEIVITIHKTFLKKSGITSDPLSFGNGKEVLDYLTIDKESDSEYLILLDINMPVLGAWEFLDEISAWSFANRIYVVLVTSSINKIDKEKALKYKNAVEFVEKPISMEDCMRIKTIAGISSYFKKN